MTPPNHKNALFALKLRAYNRHSLAYKTDASYTDFVIFAKTYLSIKYGVLFKDPIWEKYTDEEILIEYFTHVFAHNEDFRREAEVELGMYDESTYNWLDEKVSELDSEFENFEGEEEVSFNPTKDIATLNE